jgi:CheY-like chemotaxis protein
LCFEVEDPDSQAILVVEDDSEVRQFVVRVLRAQGYVILEAGSGEEGLRTFQSAQNRIELIVTDVRMPHMSGTEMIRQILAVAPTVGIVFMTGDMAGSSLSDELYRRSILLRKPFSRTTLLDTVRRCVSAGKPSQI